MMWFLVLLILALLFGVGAVLEGLLWLLLIAAVLAVGAIVLGTSVLRR